MSLEINHFYLLQNEAIRCDYQISRGIKEGLILGKRDNMVILRVDDEIMLTKGAYFFYVIRSFLLPDSHGIRINTQKPQQRPEI
ncbi:MAG: hypothetical protein SV375_10080 [Thermodesulfobacteriota bacterium]|nr:hypothetical protein [Thermodesulfobacteriota bacterium]